MKDYLTHYQMFDYRARCVVVSTKNIVKTLQERHRLDPITTIALGRAINCAAMLASTLKSEVDYISCTWRGQGLLETVFAECNGAGECRGYTTPESVAEDLEIAELMPEKVSDVLGTQGTLTVIHGRRDGVSKPYTAILEFMNGEIASDIAHYLAESEQIPSAVAAGVKLSPTGEVLASGGVLVQKLAGTNLDEKTLKELEVNMAEKLHISERLAKGESVIDILNFLTNQTEEHTLLLERDLCFKCTCSRDRMSSALVLLGEEQIKTILDEFGKIETRCPFCAHTELFGLEELMRQ